MKNIRYFLFAITLAMFSITSLTAMKDQYSTLVDSSKELSLEDIQQRFDMFKKQENPFLCMVLRLVCAQKFNVNLDELDAVYFLTNIQNWVNGSNLGQTTSLLSEENLQHVLPLLEAIIQKAVTRLDLSGQGLTMFPDAIDSLPNLKNLCLAHNQIAELPESIGDFKKLENLNLAFNKLTKIPDTIGRLTRLCSLNLSHNKLIELSKSIGDLVGLQGLDVSENNLIDLPDAMINLKNVETLWVDRSVVISEALQRQKGLDIEQK